MSQNTEMQELIQLNRQLISAFAAFGHALSKFEVDGKMYGGGDSDGKGNSAAEEETELKVAGKKTYIFFRDTNTGCVVEKGEEIPQHDGAIALAKTKWEAQCKKHELDPETGKPAGSALDDLDGLDADLEGSDDLNLDEDLDLGLEEEEEAEEEYTREDVKKQFMALKGSKGREGVLSVFKALKIKNADALEEEQFGEAMDFIERAMKAKKITPSIFS